jgi:hypothetical protein
MVFVQPPLRTNRVQLSIALSLLIFTGAAFWGVWRCEFVGYDDPAAVSHHPMVNQGVRGAAVLWAFSAAHNANWEPLTAISHMVDCSLFGLDASKHHGVNLLWHLLNTALVYFVWLRLTGAPWASALVGGLFALHPLHVESVAWVSQRKDLISTAAWLATLLAYRWYVDGRSRARYGLVLVGTVLAMMAKPMAVTLPATLLLLDFWPLRRWRAGETWSLVVEKAPLFLLAAGVTVATIVVQRAEGAASFGEELTVEMRLGNAVVSYARYLGKTLWPAQLSPFYPHPGHWPWGTVVGATVLLSAGSWLAWRERSRRPWLGWGWAWWLVTLVPTIGLIPTGSHAMADRYTYVSLLGVFTIAAWAAREAVGWRPALRLPVVGVVAVALGACAWRSAAQVGIWENGTRLCDGIWRVVGEHPVYYRILAGELALAGRPEAEIAEAHRRALRLRPDDLYHSTELAWCEIRSGQHAEGRARLEGVCRRFPEKALAWVTLSDACAKQGLMDEALAHLRRALALDPGLAIAHRSLGHRLAAQGRWAEAAEALARAVREDRWDWVAWNDRGIVAYRIGRTREALSLKGKIELQEGTE